MPCFKENLREPSPLNLWNTARRAYDCKEKAWISSSSESKRKAPLGPLAAYKTLKGPQAHVLMFSSAIKGPFLWKWVLFAWEWKIVFMSKAEQLSSFWYRGPGKLGNGLPMFSVPESVCWLCFFSHQEQFNRFLGFLASLRNDGILRKCYLVPFWDVGIYLKPHFYTRKKCK